MDKSVKKMVKLIEEDADSLSKKAEMYYQKRPELISLVDEFHRMYRSLAERYDELSSSDLTSTDLNNNKFGRPPSRRAPGFDYFLGNNGGMNTPNDVEDCASVTDSEQEWDDASSVSSHPVYVNVGNDFQSMTKRVADLEIELRDAKERLRMQLEGNTDGLVKIEPKFIDYPTKLAACEQELREANERILNSEDQIFMLKNQLARYLPSVLDDDEQVSEGADSTQEMDVETLSEELRIANLRLREAERDNGIMRREVEKAKSDDLKLKSIQNMLESAQKEIAAWKSKSSADRREVVKLHDRVSMLKHSLAGRDHEIRDLKTALSDAEEKIFPEKAQFKAEITTLLEEKTQRDEQFNELEAQVRFLEDEIRRVSNEKTEEEERLKGEIEALTMEKEDKEICIETVNKKMYKLESEMILLEHEMKAKESKTMEMEEEVEKLRKELEEVAEEKREVIRQLCFSLDYSKDECKRLHAMPVQGIQQ
ncbi:unnamed protein product [Eruca vesicaria subsp. sativa]|uniref:NAB domain-containing protein n=1 Tax=Eruca vesicaria subsp. sativa TaxID=29727 RepID=A0ABC8L0R7_ERUVS|nr:unnamed protein product [Eruca vesicaria subsp. sativa]